MKNLLVLQGGEVLESEIVEVPKQAFLPLVEGFLKRRPSVVRRKAVVSPSMHIRLMMNT
jgi:hypothetical protein